MSKITVIGLGEMGSAIARTLMENGFEVTIWNRSAEKAENLVAGGAKLAETARDAIEASPLILTCVTNYEATREIFGGGVSAALRDKTLVEFATGTPEEARTAEKWARSLGVKYLDAAIAATPALLGQSGTPIFVAGPAPIFEEHQSALGALGDLKFTGEAIGSAATFDLGFLAYFWGATLGFINAATLFEKEGIPLSTLGAMLGEISPVIGEMVRHEAGLIEHEKFENPQSSLEICLQSAIMILRQSEESGTNPDISRFTRDFFQKGVDAGYGKEGIGSLIKIMRKHVR